MVGAVGGLLGGGQFAPAGASSNQHGAATVYTPTGQQTADQQFQSLISSMYGPFMAGATAPQQNAPIAENAALNVAQNPYAAQAQSEANYLSGAGPTNMYGQPAGPVTTGNQAQVYGNALLGTAPYDIGLGNQAAALAPQVAQPIGQLQQASGNILQQGYDPQNALYNRMLQQTVDQSGSANAMAGLGNSPYGAGLQSDALRNFNIDWQNQQLGRQQQALGAAGAGYGQAAGLGSAAGGLYNTAANIYGRAAPSAQNALSLAQGGTQLAMGAEALPYQTSIGQSQAALPALQAANTIGNQQYQLPQQILGDLLDYQNLGQRASQLSGNLGALGVGQGQQAAAGLTGLLGNLSGGFFGNQGLTGALGGNQQTGILGILQSLFGGGLAIPSSSGGGPGNWGGDDWSGSVG